jgi:hypothetical protein
LKSEVGSLYFAFPRQGENDVCFVRSFCCLIIECVIV